jgi:outer membrane protein assembly factor BamB
MRRVVSALLVAGAATLLAACGSTGKPKPTPLENITPQIAGRVVWTARVDAVRFPLAVAVHGGNFFVAGDDGTVAAIDAQTGRDVWRASVGARLSAGVGSDGRFAAVVSREGELVVLEGGAVKWRKALGARVTTAPLVAGERVFVLGVDRAVQAFDALDGRKLWALARPGDPLTLAQNGVLVAFRDTLVAGQGSRLAGIDPLRGTVRWEVPVASPRGTNEVERLADLVGPAARVGDLICARSFQAAVGCVNAERGTLAWSRNFGGTEGIAADAEFSFAADGAGRVSAWKTAGGEAVWNHERFLYRGLSAPLVLGPAVVFGDAEGYLHWLSRAKGETLLRLATDGSAIVGAPVVSGTTMLAVTRSGGLYGFRPD